MHARRLGRMLVALAAAHAKIALPSEPAISLLGQSGGLVIPYGTLLPTGDAEFQFNDYKDPRFATQASNAQSYFAAFGLLPYVEVSAGLVNYAKPQRSAVPGQESFVFRHLLGNAKLGLPRLFDYQPDIAIGATDFGGQTKFFRSKYVVATQSFGPASFALGAGWGGQRLNGVFGGVELALGHSGLSVLAEHDSSVAYAGLRYRSPAIPWLWDARIVGTAQRSLNAGNGGRSVDRTAVSLSLRIPLGRRYNSGASEALARGPELIASDSEMSGLRLEERSRSLAVPRIETRAAAEAIGEGRRVLDAKDDMAMVPRRCSSAGSGDDTERLSAIRDLLIRLGLERVKVGRYRHYLIVEYENHRYNQNEADALGIVFGVAARLAPCEIVRVAAVIEKAGAALGQVSVDSQSFAAFIAGGQGERDVGDTLLMSTRPTFSDSDVAWVSREPGAHALARIEIEPKTSYLVGTEYGKFDYSLAANIEGFVPLWKGAELYTSYVAPIKHSANVGSGRVFSAFALETGLSNVTLNQILWANARTLNVASVGQIDFHYLGIEDEMTFFVPSRPDVVRLRLAYLKRRHEASAAQRRNVENAALLYRWVQPSWHVWVEAGVARYVGGDRGPLLNVVRWFDDVAVTLSASHSGLGTFAGVSISFPLTPRQGMRPGVIEVSGAETVPLSIRTRVGGGANTVTSEAVENLSFGYGTERFLLNQGRFSEAYFQSQLYRMRDAYRRFALPAVESTK